MMPPIDVVCDASVVLKWFRDEDEEEVDASRALLDLHIAQRVALSILDLTAYEVANVLVRGLRTEAREAAAILNALGDICPRMAVSLADLAVAAVLAERHGLTVYDAAYAAVAASRGAELATMDRALLDAGLGRRPSEILTNVT
jgi:predicted nucleic acid-binding protein